MSSPNLIAIPLVVLVVLLVVAAVVVFVVLRRRRRPQRGFDVKSVLPVDPDERVQ